MADRTYDINLTETSINRGLDLLIQYIDKKKPGKGQDEAIRFHTAMYFHGVSAMLLKWLRDGRVVTKDQIVNYCVDAMPDILKPYLENKKECICAYKRSINTLFFINLAILLHR